jgi:transposase
MFPTTMELILSAEERRILTGMLRATTISAGLARRARVILALADGDSYATIAATLGVTDTYIARWKKRVVEGGLPALGDLPRSGRPDRLDPKLEAKILAKTHERPPAPFTHWTTRRLAKALGTVSHGTVHRVWQRAGLKPHRLERYVTSDDPDFETKAADVIGLYLRPPANAVVFSVDEKSQIQALDRLDPVLPLSPGRAERHGFEYKRNGTLSLYAALEVATGRVEGMTATSHSSPVFVRFLDQLVATQPTGQEIHIIADNFAAHKTKTVTEWLAAHPRVHLHFTPTYSSWLNQIELWFAKIERDMIARGIFTSTADLRRKLLQYIRAHNKTCQPIQWSYSNIKHRITAPRTSVASH